MANNVTFPVPDGTITESLDTGGGVQRQTVTISPRDLSTGDSIGNLTETPPGTDTASSGLNGRLQRVAQNQTSGQALTGSLTETPPGTDTASSGLNGRMQRLAQNVTTLNGKIDALSILVGAVTETAPSTDTASSGLNGRLQRNSQRLTTLIGSGIVATNVTGAGAAVEVIPTVTAGSYTAGFVIGGIMTFANILPATFNGVLTSISLKFKATLQITEFDVAIFTASPAGTFADHGAPAIAAADTAILTAIYPMTANISSLGTHTAYTLDGIAKEIVGSSTSLFAVVTTKSIPVAPASTTEMSLRLGVIW